MYSEMKKYFWGGKLWSYNTFVETIVNANEKTVINFYLII